MIPPPNILCVDDDEDDREMVYSAFREIDPLITIVHAENGKEALDYLSAAKLKESLPCLILLDINMPKMDGKETLLEIKKDGVLSKIPLVMFTTSSSISDRTFCLEHEVDMVTKPATFQLLIDKMSKLLHNCSKIGSL
jgi:CheY-like chemotaxis protein